MQRKAGAFLVKRIGDELFAKPSSPPPAEPESAADEDDLDRRPFTDEDGQTLGTAYRLPGIAVYVVLDRPGDRNAELERCLEEPESQLYVRREGGRITALIYTPHPNRPRPQGDAPRAEDV